MEIYSFCSVCPGSKDDNWLALNISVTHSIDISFVVELNHNGYVNTVCGTAEGDGLVDFQKEDWKAGVTKLAQALIKEADENEIPRSTLENWATNWWEYIAEFSHITNGRQGDSSLEQMLEK